jgi:hypothetical protein
MPFFERKPRSMHDLLNDPDFIARAFRLLGCSEAIVAYMQTLDDLKAETMARKLEGAADWFFENDDLGGWSPRRRPRYAVSETGTSISENPTTGK